MNKFDQEIMARTAVGEARGEGPVGMQAVMWTGLNRFTSKKWFSGLTIAGTFLKPGQFSCWMPHDSNFLLIIDQGAGIPAYDHAMQWAECVLKGSIPDPTKGATHYVNLAIAQPAWIKTGKETIKLGNHTFFTDVP